MEPGADRRHHGWVDARQNGQRDPHQGWHDWSTGARMSPLLRRGRLRPRVPGPLRRQQQGRMAGGVAAGISARTGISVNVIRVVFVLTSLPGGFGAAVYVLAWLLVPAAGEES